MVAGLGLGAVRAPQVLEVRPEGRVRAGSTRDDPSERLVGGTLKKIEKIIAGGFENRRPRPLSRRESPQPGRPAGSRREDRSQRRQRIAVVKRLGLVAQLCLIEATPEPTSGGQPNEEDLTMNEFFVDLLAQPDNMSFIRVLAEPIARSTGYTAEQLANELRRLTLQPGMANGDRPPWRKITDRIYKKNAGKRLREALCLPTTDSRMIRLSLQELKRPRETFDATAIIFCALMRLSDALWARDQVKTLYRGELRPKSEEFTYDSKARSHFENRIRRAHPGDERRLTRDAVTQEMMALIEQQLGDCPFYFYDQLTKLEIGGGAECTSREPIQWANLLGPKSKPGNIVVTLIHHVADRAGTIDAHFRNADCNVDAHGLRVLEEHDMLKEHDVLEEHVVLKEHDMLLESLSSYTSYKIATGNFARKARMLEIHCLESRGRRARDISNLVQTFGSDFSKNQDHSKARACLLKVRQGIVEDVMRTKELPTVARIGQSARGVLEAEAIYVRRIQDDVLAQAIQRPLPFILISGAQQSGKSTLSRRVVPNHQRRLVDFQGRSWDETVTGERIRSFIHHELAQESASSHRVAIFDEVDAVQWSADRLGMLASEVANLMKQKQAVVVISNRLSASDFQPCLSAAGVGGCSLVSIALQDFTEDEVLSLIRSYEDAGSVAFSVLFSDTEDASQVIFDYFGGHPQLTHTAVQSLANYEHALASISLHHEDILGSISSRLHALHRPRSIHLLDAMVKIAENGSAAVTDERRHALTNAGLLRTDGEIRTPFLFDLLEKQGVLRSFEGRHDGLLKPDSEALLAALWLLAQRLGVEHQYRRELVHRGLIRLDGTIRLDSTRHFLEEHFLGRISPNGKK